jgi:hypothetical protein
MRFSHLQSRCQRGYIQVHHTQFFLCSNIMCAEEEEEDPRLGFRVAYSLHSSEVKDNHQITFDDIIAFFRASEIPKNNYFCCCACMI